MKKIRYLCPYCNNGLQCQQTKIESIWCVTSAFCFTCGKDILIKKIKIKQEMEEENKITLSMGRNQLIQPENTKITITQESGVMVALVEPMQLKFKKGDIVFTPSDGIDYDAISILDGEYEGKMMELCIFMPTPERLCLDKHTFFAAKNSQLATESQKQILFDALEKDGKRYNAEKHCIEDLQEKILVPENIEIYKKIGNDNLHIRISDNQLLRYNHSVGNYSVTALSELDLKTCYSRVQCELVPCGYEDLQPGDLVVAIYDYGITHTEIMCLMLNDNKVMETMNLNIIDMEVLKYENVQIHKVTPIK